MDPSDSGSYVCRVQNDFSDPQPEDTSTAINLEYCSKCVWMRVCAVRSEIRSEWFVSLSPVVPPTIVEDLTFSNINPKEGEETVASCAWTGDPQPTVTWLKDGKVLDGNDFPSRFRITMLTMDGRLSSELQVDFIALEDTGDYTCNVSNPVGYTFQIKRLEVKSLGVSDNKTDNVSDEVSDDVSDDSQNTATGI